jgi:hypothetical protein
VLEETLEKLLWNWVMLSESGPSNDCETTWKKRPEGSEREPAAALDEKEKDYRYRRPKHDLHHLRDPEAKERLASFWKN